MNKFAVLAHGRFDHRSDPNSVIEQMARDLSAAGYDVKTLECDEPLPGEWSDRIMPGDEVIGVGFSNGAPQIIGIIQDLKRLLIVVKRLVLFDPVVKNIVGQIPLWPFHEDIFVPVNVEKCIVYMRGNADKGRVRVNDQITVVHMLSDAITDHPRVPELAQGEALALLTGGEMLPLEAPVPGAEAVA